MLNLSPHLTNYIKTNYVKGINYIQQFCKLKNNLQDS